MRSIFTRNNVVSRKINIIDRFIQVADKSRGIILEIFQRERSLWYQ